jgi:hypothetical protein
MDYFRIVGEGAQSPHPIEKVVTSAIEAQAESSALRRLCGRYGRVEVWNKQGRRVTPERLQNLAIAERGAMSLAQASADPGD